jgi:tRNA G26 N,N-dimethylase Trm1
MRDILFLGALLFLVKIAFERTTSFISEHKKSIVHELDRTFIDELYTTQRQLHFLEENCAHNDEVVHAISGIKERLATIEEKYKTNSPGIMLLGPIGSAAIVNKEEKLKNKLLDVVNDINKLLHTIDNQEPFQQITTISAALESNKQLFQKITV